MPHREVTRLEGFSDAVFGFAPTLLVQLETPDTPAERDVEYQGRFGWRAQMVRCNGGSAGSAFAREQARASSPTPSPESQPTRGHEQDGA